ncbi:MULTISPECIES: hypothetical protein [unclassified Lactobacillus]|uniref:hypothetical protein n=1 Tax=unclassified Lactobacillus TaxID=2620435 RepID=UPI000EFAF0FB|nr:MULTISPECIES: hypothetical protein [unclassified Lactobacillus]RMC38748.1 hypothetical protein F5ESL0237_07375 [Lactobacillus sp. ESL0237]RMC43093.1 hypothetical protein F5ESL0234_07380 [Lactobacillus sp. ESL0234]RMC43947.1 hypothetical protein F5ESL0236_07385 [Lactobacillus sp. ESL0236]RMC44950.1 hypothetical protein F5ESL0230_08195 [Lactobacillus sp. ESL0230]RMC48194.1 hypothetical protein F5ESL0225_07725 [Lactobacillus sp. ESL0225]
MEKQKYRNRITFWLRVSGWLCLLPASGWLWLYRTASWSSYSVFFLIELIVTVAFAVFILTTATSKGWLKRKNLVSLLTFAILFLSLIVFIPLIFSYNACSKFNKEQ